MRNDDAAVVSAQHGDGRYTDDLCRTGRETKSICHYACYHPSVLQLLDTLFMIAMRVISQALLQLLDTLTIDKTIKNSQCIEVVTCNKDISNSII